MHPSLESKKIHLTIDANLLALVDTLARRDYTTRSDILRMALLEYVRKPDNTDRPQAAPGEDAELQKFLADYHKAHPNSGLI